MCASSRFPPVAVAADVSASEIHSVPFVVQIQKRGLRAGFRVTPRVSVPAAVHDGGVADHRLSSAIAAVKDERACAFTVVSRRVS